MALLVTIGTLVVAGWPALSAMSAMWRQDEYGHAWLIAPLAALLFLHRLPQATNGGRRWPGVLAAGSAVLLLLAGWATRNTTLTVYGLIVGFLALTWSSFGQASLRRLGAPIAFLLFMIPLPLAVYISLSQGLQLLSSKLGVGLMRVLGVVVTREGNIIDLMNGRLEVAEACNGLRYLFPLLSIAFLLAILAAMPLWRKAILFMSALPVAIVLNAGRLAVIGVLVDRYGIAMAGGWQHEAEGFLVFALCVGLLALELRLLLAWRGSGRFPAADVLIPGRRAFGAVARWPAPRPFLAAAAVVSVGALMVFALPIRTEQVPDRRPLALFPMRLGPWSGTPHTLDADTLGALGLTDYVLAGFSEANAAAGGDDPVDFYVAYYASQRLGVQVHSPRLCIPGGGWSILDQKPASVTAADGSTITANRVVIEKNGVKQVVFYWFEERGRRLTAETQIKLYALVDAVVRDRSDGALVRLVTPVKEGGEGAADARLRALAREASAVLRPFVPG